MPTAALASLDDELIPCRTCANLQPTRLDGVRTCDLMALWRWPGEDIECLSFDPVLP